MSDFQYSYRAYDLPDSKQESEDLIDARDKQLEYYLKTNNAAINAQITALVPRVYIRAGTGVITLPATLTPVTVAWNSGFFTNVNIAAPFPSTVTFKGIIATISNGDPAANPANLGIENLGLSSFNIYHLSNGNVGNACRFNVFAYAYEF
jgi:hypothetical protein